MISNLSKNNSPKIRGQYNFFRVLRSIWLNKGISRIELCHKLNLDKATMSSIVSLLLQFEIVKEYKVKVVAGKPGRRPIGLCVNSSFGYVIGFEFHTYGLQAVVKDMLFNTVQTFDFPQRIKSKEIKGAFLGAYSEIKSSLKDKTILGVGVSIPGIVNPEKGLIIDSWELGIMEEPYDFQKEVFDILDVPGFLDNDANCCAGGILTAHRSAEYQNFLFTYFNFKYHDEKKYQNDDHLSVGFGVVLDGRLYSGPDFTVGEFQTMNQKKQRINQFGMSLEEEELYGDSQEVQENLFKNFASHLALIINFFNFERLFIGGDIPHLLKEPKEIIQNEINANWPYGENRSCEISILDFKECLPSSGAAGMFLEMLFSVPDLDHQRGAALWERIVRAPDIINF